ncbi:hypothetical protein EYZ11_001695 [Aspergillus tanneri]|uniref:Xylanolytic transcriptional activator regulatory domain-containing protein n=1 Tax=Aspergillus tanneri TaxID=1220188 RepID=A0A4S3JTR8_9EURO|nr:hypothetical protein EYZ11_001695 [Aspergillus tanneri]
MTTPSSPHNTGSSGLPSIPVVSAQEVIEGLNTPSIFTLRDQIQDVQHRLQHLERSTVHEGQRDPTHDRALDQTNVAVQDLTSRLRKAEEQLSELSRNHQGQPSFAKGNLTIPATIPRLRNTTGKAKLFGPSHWLHTAEKFNLSQLDAKDLELSFVDSQAELAGMIQECRNLRKSVKKQQAVQLNDPIPDLLSTFPPREICDQLVGNYMRTFELIYRVVHIPSFWKEYEIFWKQPLSTSMPFLVKLGLMLTIGMTFYADRDEHLARLGRIWIYAAQWWLVGPSEKSTANLDGLQVFCLLHVSRQTCFVGASPWLSEGSLLRMAMTMGLHRDPRLFHLTPFHSEIRTRLWTTVLELVIHASTDASLPLLLSPCDFDDHVPHNVKDGDFNSETKDLSLSQPLEDFTESSIQILLRQSLPVRIEVAKILNNHHTEQSYDTAIDLAAKLQSACREIAAFCQLHWSQSLTMHYKFLDMQFRRYILLLHRPYMLRARKDPRFYLSRKICLESAMIIAACAENIKIPSDVLDDLSRMMISSTGSFRGALTLDVISALAMEIITQLEETGMGSSSSTGDLAVDPLTEMARAQREPIIQILAHIEEQLLQIIGLGYPSMKRYVFLAGILRQIRAMESGQSVQPAVVKTLRDSLKKCCAMLRSSQTANAPQDSFETLIHSEPSSGLYFDPMDPNLAVDFSSFLFTTFGGEHEAGL